MNMINAGHSTSGDGSPIIDSKININQQITDLSTKIDTCFKDCKKEFDKFSTKSDVESLTKKIEDLGKKITDLGKKPPKNHYNCLCKLFRNNWFLVGIIIILLGTIIFCLIPKIDITNNYVSAILGFVGILATFVVIGNYAQVQETKNNFAKMTNDALSKYKQTIKDEVKKQINSYEHVIKDDVKKYMNLNMSSGQYHLFLIESIIDSVMHMEAHIKAPHGWEISDETIKNNNLFYLERINIAYILTDGLFYNKNIFVDTTNVVSKINYLVSIIDENIHKDIHNYLCDIGMLLEKCNYNNNSSL